MCYDLLNAEWPADVQWGLGGAEDYLHEAALASDPPSGTFYDPERDGTNMASQGTHEHRDDAADKMYSRDLGLDEGIELVKLNADLEPNADLRVLAATASDAGFALLNIGLTPGICYLVEQSATLGSGAWEVAKTFVAGHTAENWSVPANGQSRGFFRVTGIPPYVARIWTPLGSFAGGVEGPCVDADGNLYAMDFQTQGTIGKSTPEGRGSLFVTLPSGSKGNGSRLDSHGNLLVTDPSGKRILKVEIPTGTMTEFASDPRMAGPNDLAITSNDVLYVSDPDWSGSNGKIWRVDTNGDVTLPVDDLGPVNGIEISPDGTRLYANDALHIWAYDIQPDGSLTNQTDFYTHPSSPMPMSTYDGMRCDREGNLYVAMWVFGKVMELDADGNMLRHIPMVNANWRPTNVAFGGPDGRTLCVTVKEGDSAATGHIEMFRVDAPGRIEH